MRTGRSLRKAPSRYCGELWTRASRSPVGAAPKEAGRSRASAPANDRAGRRGRAGGLDDAGEAGGVGGWDNATSGARVPGTGMVASVVDRTDTPPGRPVGPLVARGLPFARGTADSGGMAFSTVVVMGVSGVGKTTVARPLAERLGVPFAEADDFHSEANIAKMSAGTPLTDEDRRPWLEAIGGWLRERRASGEGGVVTCSALKRSYRDLLRAEAGGPVFFLHLAGSAELVGERVERRTDHFMPPSLLRSQLATLEPLGDDETGLTLDVSPGPDRLVADAAEAVAKEG